MTTLSSYKPLVEPYTITPVSCRIRQWFCAVLTRINTNNASALAQRYNNNIGRAKPNKKNSKESIGVAVSFYRLSNNWYSNNWHSNNRYSNWCHDCLRSIAISASSSYVITRTDLTRHFLLFSRTVFRTNSLGRASGWSFSANGAVSAKCLRAFYQSHVC